MIFLLALSILLIPVFMLVTDWMIAWCATVYNVAAVLSAYLTGMIIASSIYVIIRDDQVFMTTIHRIFQNQAFLLCGSYLGAYGIYSLQKLTFKHIRSNS